MTGTGYGDGYDTGAGFRAMEERGWNPGSTYLACVINHQDDQDWVRGFEHAVSGAEREPGLP